MYWNCFINIDFAGYARIILAIISIYFMPTNYKVACTCYVISALLDAFDGHAARLFNQSKITKEVKMNLVRLL